MRHRSLSFWLVSVLLLCLSTGLVWGQASPQGANSVWPVLNDPTTGTTQYRLAKVTSTGAVLAAVTDTAVKLYVVAETAGTSGYASLNLTGLVSCYMDATTTNARGQNIVVGTGGACHPQVADPTNGYVLGTLADNATTSGQTALINSQLIAFVPPSGITGTGTMTNYNVVTPAEWTTSGCNVSVSGTCTIGKATQTANQGYRGPASGAAAAPTFRADVEADMPPSWMLSGFTTPTTLSGDANNYGPAGWTTTGVLRINGGAADRNITGFAALPPGAVRIVMNVGTTNALILKELNGGSSAANQLSIGGDMTLNPKDSALVWYDTTATKFQAIAQAIPDKYKIYTCLIPFGSARSDAAPLVDDDDELDTCPNDTGKDMVITAVACLADAGAPTINPILKGGTATSILSSVCTCGTGTTWGVCVVNGTPLLHSFSGSGNATCGSPPCTLDGNIQAAGGTAKRLKIKIVRVEK